MGFLVKQDKEIEKIVVTIPAASVSLLRSNAYELVPLNFLNNNVLLSAHLSIVDPVGLIDNFGHFYLGYKSDTFPAAIYDNALGDIDSVDSIYSFLVDASHPPNRFGANNRYRSYAFDISTSSTPNANCDLIVTLYFIK
jgi:hypothetical protein